MSSVKHEVIPISLVTCARCGQGHVDIVFYPLHNAPHDITHWGMCPIVQQPILMTVKEEGTINGDGAHVA